MANELFEELKAYVGFGQDDVERIVSLAGRARTLIPEVVDRFYAVLLQHPKARAVLAGGEEQMIRQRRVLSGWMSELFDGVYDQRYFESRHRIGAAHVQVGLPQRYMLLGMELVRQEMARRLRDHSSGDVERKLESLHKLLNLDLTIMLESYKDTYSEQIRSLERWTMETKLMRAEHLAEIGQLAASLAHEIKNPLAGISGAIQVIGESLGKDNPYRPVVVDILGQISRLDDTVKDLLLYARPTPPNSREIKLGRLVPRVLTLLQEEPAMRKINVVFDGAATEATIFADEGQIEQLLMNLILNAAHACKDRGDINIEAHTRATSTVLQVRDTGCGMTEEVRGKAPEPFFTTKAKGTGLGLAICRRIAESNGGGIELTSKPGVGTTVMVYLPNGPDGAGVGIHP